MAVGVSPEIIERFIIGTEDLAAKAAALSAQAKELRAATPPLRENAEKIHRDALVLFRELEHLLIETQTNGY